MKKRLFAMLLAVVMVAALLPTAFAADTSGKCGENLTWTYSDGTLTISGEGAMDSYGDFETPWIDLNMDIHTIIIEEGVTSICNSAFDSCINVTDVTIPASLTSIGRSAFGWCGGLTSIEVASENPAYVSVDGVLFNADQTILHTYPAGKSDESYTIPASVTTIFDSAFTGSGNLTSVVIPAGITAIDRWTFAGCVGLTSVTIPDSVTTIGESAFFFCEGLTDVYYSGDESQWEEVTIGENNDPLVNATVNCSSTGAPETPDITFSDVKETDWFYSDVQWAVQNGWVNGNGDGTFTPEEVCNEEMILTLLHHTKDSPDSTVTAPVTVDFWAQDAVNWAYEQKVIDDTFQTNTPGTRARAIYYLWKVYGSESAGSEVSFTDVPEDADYIDALAWAVKEGIVEGNGDGTFDPDGAFQRAHLVRFVHRVIDPAVRVNVNA